MTINWKRRAYTRKQFEEAWYSSISVSECAGKLGIGRTSPTTKNTALQLGLSWEHIKGKAHGTSRSGRPLVEWLVEGTEITSSSLKTRLLREGYLTLQCSRCTLVEWQGLPIPLELDHIDGNRFNNRIENLRLLCPNCHALTPTYRAKNIGAYPRRLISGAL